MRLLSLAVLLTVCGELAAQDARTPAQVSEQEQRQALEELVRRDQQRVTIDVRNADLSTIIEEFRKQTNVNIVADLRNVPADYRVSEFKVKDAPFREAFDHFLKLAQLVVVEETANVIRIERPILMSLDVPEADIKDVLALIAKVSGANIIVAPEKITGKVKLTVNNVPWTELLESVVKTVGHATVRERYDIIRVITTEELQRQMTTRVFKLKYLTAPPSYRAKIEAPKYVDGKPLKPVTNAQELESEFAFLKIISKSLTRSATNQVLGTFDYDINTNALVVTDTKPKLDQIESIIKILDVEPDQVSVSLKFVSTTNSDVLSWGTSYFTIDQLGSLQEGFGLLSRPTPTQGVPSAAASSPLGAFGTTQRVFSTLPFGLGGKRPDLPNEPFYFLTEYDVRALFRAFKKDGYTRVLQEPQITVLDNTEATIFVGEEVPYAEAQLQINPGAASTVTIREGQRSPVKVGFQVLVIPRILKDENKVILTIIPQNLTLTGTDTRNPGFERFSLSGQDIVLPRVGQTTVLTKLKIDDGQTAVLGGLVVERVSYEDKGIPGLKDIPVLNFLFKKKEDTTTKERLLIFITPRIVRSGQSISEAARAKMRLKEAEVEKELEELRKSRKDPDLRKRIEKWAEEDLKKYKEPPK